MEEENKKIELSNRVFILIAILVLGLVVSYLGQMAYQFSSLPQNYPKEITITGEGKVFAKPDIATVSLGVKTEGAKSADVVSQNNEKMNAIISSVKELGVEDKDIKTSAYYLTPVYDYSEWSGRVFRGYSLDQRITVKIRNFEKISDILDKATTEGANNISDLQFSVEDPEKSRSDARKEAIGQAKAKAEKFAADSGLKLVKLVNISEGYYPVPGYGLGGAGDSMLKEANVAPRIEAGQLEINSTVYLTYRVR
jgi:hypothetical protein